MQYKHILFDLDRTLWDFKKNNDITLKELFNNFKLHERCNCSFEIFYDVYSVINASLWENYRQGQISKEMLIIKRFQMTLEHFNATDFSDVTTMAYYYLDESPKKTQLLPHALEILDYLHQKKYNLYIITNGFKEVQYTKVQESKIKHYFSHIFVSEEIGYTKPNVKIFEHVLSTINATSEESIMIGDDFKVDIIGACNANIDSVFYNPSNIHYDTHQNTYEINCLSQLKNIL